MENKISEHAKTAAEHAYIASLYTMPGGPETWAVLLAGFNSPAVTAELNRKRYQIATGIQRHAIDPATRELREALKNLLADSTDTYYEWCRAHAPKDDHGAVIGSILHATGCPHGDALALLESPDAAS